MSSPVKFRKHTEKVHRTKPDAATRLGKLRLDKNERIQAFPEDLWKELLGGITQDMVQAYPEVWPLYRKLADRHGLGPDNFLLTAGADAVIRHCFEAFVSPGDAVVYPQPTFAMVSVYSDLFQATRREIGYGDDLVLDLGLLHTCIDDRTTLIVLANPNSPTGTCVTNEDIAAILNKAAAFRIPVLIDEAYYGFNSITAQELLREHSNLIIARTFSKITGIAGLRIGYAMGHPAVISHLSKFKPMYEVGSISLLFAQRMLDRWQVAEEYGRRTIEGRNRFADFLRALGFPVINTETNFLHVDFKKQKKSILDELERADILVRGMLSVPGYEHYTRFSVGPWENMLPAVTIIERCTRGQNI